MKKQEINRLCQEFLFLNNIQLEAKFDWDVVDRIEVKRGDKNVLLKIPQVHQYKWGDNGSIQNGEVVFSVSGQGVLRELLSERKHESACGLEELNFEESSSPIWQQIDISLKFILEIFWYENFKSGGGIETKIHITVYKFRDFDLAGFRDRMHQKAWRQEKKNIM